MDVQSVPASVEQNRTQNAAPGNNQTILPAKKGNNDDGTLIVTGINPAILYSLSTDPSLAEMAAKKSEELFTYRNTIDSEQVINKELRRWDDWLCDGLKDKGVSFIYATEDQDPAQRFIGSFNWEKNAIVIPSYDYGSKKVFGEMMYVRNWQYSIKMEIDDHLRSKEDQDGIRNILGKKHPLIGAAKIETALQESRGALMQQAYKNVLNYHLVLFADYIDSMIRSDKKDFADAIDHETCHSIFNAINGVFYSNKYDGPRIEDFVRSYKGEIKKRSDRAKQIIAMAVDYRLAGTEAEVSAILEENYDREPVNNAFEKAKHILKFMYNEGPRYSIDQYQVVFAGRLGKEEPKSEINRFGLLEESFVNSIYSALKSCDLGPIGQYIQGEKLPTKKTDVDYYTCGKYVIAVSGDNIGILYKIQTPGYPGTEKYSELTRTLYKAYKKAIIWDQLFDEIFARQVDSLMNVYLGPDTMRNYRLYEDDLKMFEMMKYEGKPMFKKAVEKYRLGIKMLNDGIDWQEIGKKLQYATSYEYKGVKYHWPENSVAIDIIKPNSKN